MNLLNTLNFSRPSVIVGAIIYCWLFTIGLADIITQWLTWWLYQDLYATIIATARIQALITASVLALPLFSVFLFFIRYIEILRQQLETAVRRDDLTGLLSREAFLADVRHVLNQMPDDAVVEDAFLIVDADFFKKINDSHGHVAGDRALLAITNALKKGIRGTDRLGRLGGEEFAVHLRNVTEERALEIAERLRENVREASDDADIPNLKLTVSIGAVAYKSKRDVVDLLIAADKMLYQAKDNGRDRVEFSRMEAISQAA